MQKQQFPKSFSIGDYVTFERTYLVEELANFSNLFRGGNRKHVEANLGVGGGSGHPRVPLCVLLTPMPTILGMMFQGAQSEDFDHEVRATLPVYFGENIRYSARIESIGPGQRVFGLRVLAIRRDEVVLDMAMRVKLVARALGEEPPRSLCIDSRPALAVVTGVESEIGFAIACSLGEKGWRLLLQDRGAEDQRRHLTKRLSYFDAKAEFIAADLSKAEGVAAFADVVGARHNIGLVVHLEQFPFAATINGTSAVNHSALKSIIDSAIPSMLLRQNGTVVAIGATVAGCSPICQKICSALEVAAAAMANGIEDRYAAYGVRGLVLLTGNVADSVATLPDDGQPELLPQEVADALLRNIDSELPGNAIMLEVGRERRGRIGFHVLDTRGLETKGPVSSRPLDRMAVDSAGNLSSPAAATLCKVLGLGTSVDLSAAELGSTPGWDSLKHLELLLKLETDLGIRFSAKEMAATHRFVELDSLCRQKLNVKQ